MREDRQPGRPRQARIEPDIDRAYQGRNVGRALVQPVQDRFLAAAAMADVGFDEARRLPDHVAVARQIEALGTTRELVERGHVVAHGTVGRRHDRGRPAHDVVAGKDEVLAAQRKGHVVRGVAWRRDRLERKAAAAHHVAVAKRLVGTKVGVVAHVEPRRLADMQRPRGAVAALPPAAPGEWSRCVWVTMMWFTVSPRTASSSAAMCVSSSGPGSMIATSPRPTM